MLKSDDFKISATPQTNYKNPQKRQSLVPHEIAKTHEKQTEIEN
jgi:hypothetical protein